MSNPVASDLMERQLPTLSPETPIQDAVGLLLRKRISGAPVVDPDQHLVGFLSEKDCLKILTAEAFDGVPRGDVAAYMTRDVQTITTETNLFDIVSRFLATPFRRLPVVDSDGCLLGQVTRAGALGAIGSVQDNSYMYGTADQSPPTDDEMQGVDSAMRRARGA
jgi:predicted transcriptional regulator